MGSIVRYIDLDDDKKSAIKYAISLETLHEFVLKEYPAERELKKLYGANFVLNEITEEGYYVFIKEDL
jgi:hypothetical protein